MCGIVDWITTYKCARQIARRDRGWQKGGGEEEEVSRRGKGRGKWKGRGEVAWLGREGTGRNDEGRRGELKRGRGRGQEGGRAHFGMEEEDSWGGDGKEEYDKRQVDLSYSGVPLPTNALSRCDHTRAQDVRRWKVVLGIAENTYPHLEGVNFEEVTSGKPLSETAAGFTSHTSIQ